MIIIMYFYFILPYLEIYNNNKKEILNMKNSILTMNEINPKKVSLIDNKRNDRYLCC